ncbi:MAG: PHP domain-containing protein [Dehalococcoidia bacterium]|nr:PHP domain-containing protein [Dehalococcoidia bacterium]
MIRADLHVHTCYSLDCLTPLEQIVERCLQLGLNCVAIADHNTIAGALKLKEIAPFRVIVAEEILTPAGEIMGLFLSEEIPPGLSPGETIAQIRSQGGLVAIPHPFGRPLPRNSHSLTSPEVLSGVDIIETLNARTPSSNGIDRAWRLAREYGKAASAGSDAHTIGEIGRAYVEMPEFEGPDDFLDCLAQGRILGQKSSALVHLASMWARIRKRIAGYSAGNPS